MAFLTIGLCVKNCEGFIGETMTSLVEQDFPLERMELIVVDGYSNDKTVRIIEEGVLKTGMEYRIFYESKGLGTARQIVVDNARGKYIIWLDGDMRLTRDFVRKQVEFMDCNLSVGIAKGKYGVYNETNLIAALENFEFVVDSEENKGDVTSSNLALGTSGCIYRVSAMRQIGGFDKSIEGVGEDMDVEYRIRNAGWSLSISDAVFFEKRRDTWASLWSEYYWHGSGFHDLFHKNKQVIDLSKVFPPSAILSELQRSVIAYKLTGRKAAFLLPFHWVLKRLAWLIGFATAPR